MFIEQIVCWTTNLELGGFLFVTAISRLIGILHTHLTHRFVDSMVFQFFVLQNEKISFDLNHPSVRPFN